MLSVEWYNVFDKELSRGIELKADVLGVGREKSDDEAMHIVLYDDEKAVGYGRVCLAGGDFVIDRLCVLEDFRNAGYADFMLRLIIRRLYLSGAENYFALATEKSKSLFLKLGFKEEGRFTENAVELIRLSRSGDVPGGCS